MPTPLESLVASGTKLWLDSIDPQLVVENRKFGATGATSNPIIISDLLKTGRFDEQIRGLAGKGLSDADIAWEMTDRLVKQAQEVFADVNTRTLGDDGYVSFELDPLLEDKSSKLSVEEKTRQYVELGKAWAAGHTNRMIKVPATPGGLAGARRSRRGWCHIERDPAVYKTAIRAGSRCDLARLPSIANRWRTSNRSTASL